MKNKEIKQIIFSRKKNKKWIIVALVLVLTLGGGSVAVVVILHRNGNQSEFSMPGNMAGLTFTEDMTVASGVTNVDITEASFDVENLTTELEIEEVYAVSGEEVTAGDKILKLTEDSVEEARKELERTLRDAELAYRTGAIEYEQNLITAEYTRDSAILTGQQAKDVYDETVASLQSAVTRAEEELQDAEDDIAEYESYVNDGSYKSYFKVDEYQAIYDENLKALTDKLDEWGIGWSQITGGSAGSVQAGGTAGNVLGSSGQDSNSSNVKTLASLYNILEQNLKDLEEAQEKYDDAVTNASFNLQTLQLKIPSLQQAVTEAKENQEIQQAQAKLTYETALSMAERAESYRGQELLKFTDDSVEAVRALLKNVVASALADYAEAESIYELSLLEAQTDYDTQKISASYASSIRNTSSSSVANNVTSLQVQLEQKQANAASLQEKLAAAQAKQKINQLDMEETYQETVITGQNAQTTYNATVEDLKETLQEAEETKEKREEQLQAFEDFIGSDGILYAGNDPRRSRGKVQKYD